MEDITRIENFHIPGLPDQSIIYWDGVRVGSMYSGFNSDKTDRKSIPTKWIMKFEPEE